LYLYQGLLSFINFGKRMCLSKATDLDLVTNLKAGKQEALTEIFRRYWKTLYLTALHKLHSHEEAEEIVQELFAELWDKREHVLSHSLTVHLRSYLSRAVKNKVLNHLRKKIYDQKYWEYCKQYLPVSTNSAAELAEYNELEDKLESAMGQLSEKTREIFVLHKLKGIPVGQISRKLNLSEKAVGYHLTKSVKELKVHLRDFI
jgi:RNA polymerase sigma-70 factor (family 1)